MDMRFYRVQDQIFQGNYNVFWKPRETNLADYFSKNHPPHHHLRMRPVYIYYQDNANNAIVRVSSSIHNTSLKKIPKQESNKETHLQIIKMETHRQMDGHMDRRTGGGN